MGRGDTALIEITLDFDFLNYVANHPKVNPTAFPNSNGAYQDLRDMKEGTVFLRWKEYGFFALVPMDSDDFSYTVHTMFLPETPSEEVIEAVDQGFYYTFLCLDADKLYTSACSSNFPALRLSRKVGWNEDFSRPSMIKEGSVEHFFSMDILDWIYKQDYLASIGEQFHGIVEETTNHGHDAIHDKVVGAAIVMFQCGNAIKAVCTYNAWAERSYYETMQFDESEGLITVGDMKITLDDTRTKIERVE